MFSIRMKELREANGYKSQQAFADAFGVAQSTIGHWEAGKREPNYATTIRLASFFNVTIDYLLGVSDTPRPEKKESSPAPANPETEELLKVYGLLNPEGKAQLLLHARLLASSPAFTAPPPAQHAQGI